MLLLLWVIGWLDTGSPLFLQTRVRRHQKPFVLICASECSGCKRLGPIRSEPNENGVSLIGEISAFAGMTHYQENTSSRSPQGCGDPAPQAHKGCQVDLGMVRRPIRQLIENGQFEEVKKDG